MKQQPKQPQQQQQPQQTIVVLTHGFVFVGEHEKHADGGGTITKTKNIRQWGTTNGLGQLAVSGPTKDTVLDDVGTVHYPANALVFLIPVVGAPL